MTKRQKRIKYLLDYHFGTLQHFIEERGWPIRLDEKTAKSLINNCDALTLQPDGCVALSKTSTFSDELLAVYWKERFKEASSEADRLYAIIDEAHKKA